MCKNDPVCATALVIAEYPTVDAVPVDEFKLHHILINNEGVPEVKLQFGDRYFILRTDPVDVRQVVHGRNLKEEWPSLFECSVCGCDSIDTYSFEPNTINYCPNCGAKMDGEGNG
jgi:hypothetical protein